MILRYLGFAISFAFLAGMDQRSMKITAGSQEPRVHYLSFGDQKVAVPLPAEVMPSSEVPKEFFKITPANPLQADIKLAVVKRSVQRLDQLDIEPQNEMVEYAYLLFKGRFDLIIESKQTENLLEPLIFDIFQTFPLFATRRICFYMQSVLLKNKKLRWVDMIHKKYMAELWKLSDQILASHVANRVKFRKVKRSYEGKFTTFLAEWQKERQLFNFRIETLFPRFGNIDETIDFVAQAFYLQYKTLKDGDVLIRNVLLKSDQGEAINMLTDTLEKLHTIRFIARKVLDLKKLGKRDRAEKLSGLLEIYHLMQPMRIKVDEGIIGRFMEMFNVQPGTSEWFYIECRLRHFYFKASINPSSVNGENLAQMFLNAFAFLESQIKNAVAQHLPGNFSKHIGHLVCGSTPAHLHLLGMTERVSGDSLVLMGKEVQYGAKYIHNFVENKAYESRCETLIKDYNFDLIKPLTKEEWKLLVTKRFTQQVSTKVSNVIMLEPDLIETCHAKSSTKKQQPKFDAPIKGPVENTNVNGNSPESEAERLAETPGQDGVRAVSRPPKVDASMKLRKAVGPDTLDERPVLNVPQIKTTEDQHRERPKKILALEKSTDFNELIESSKSIHEIDEDNTEEIAMYMAQFEEDMRYHNEMTMKLKKREFDMVTSVDANVSLSSKKADLGSCQVVTMRTEDFLTIPEAFTLFQDNKLNEIHFEAQHDKSAKYQWLFDPNVIIDNDTFIFICQVFGLLPGRSHLTFKEFLNTMHALTFPSAPESDKKHHTNRTVFRFYHHFIIDGVCCIPPAVGVHPEHKSSDFNHSQVAKALEYAGAFPFFFRKLQ